MDVWRSMGFYAVLLYAGLVDMPEDMIESARLDGASGYPARPPRRAAAARPGPVLGADLQHQRHAQGVRLGRRAHERRARDRRRRR